MREVSCAWPVPDFLSPLSPRFFFFGQVFSGHPGTLTLNFSLVTLAVAMLLFDYH